MDSDGGQSYADGLLTVVAAHPTAEYVVGGYDSGELQVGDIKAKRSAVLRMSDGAAITMEGIRYSNIEPLQLSSAVAPPVAVIFRPKLNQCSCPTSPIATAR